MLTNIIKLLQLNIREGTRGGGHGTWGRWWREVRSRRQAPAYKYCARLQRLSRGCWCPWMAWSTTLITCFWIFKCCTCRRTN
jgi:hypothetical protein